MATTSATSPTPIAELSNEPPRYVLVSHASLADSSAATPAAAASSATLSHPIVQYHYADDPPAAVLPRFPGERVLVLDADPGGGPPTSKSIADGLAVMGVKVADAPGAGMYDDEPGDRKMYVIETMSAGDERPSSDGSEDGATNVHDVLARFKQRNAVLRAALGIPGVPQPSSQTTIGASSPPPLQ